MCKISEIFGKPNEGFHAQRIFGVAAVDLLLTALVALVISFYSRFSFLVVFVALMFLGVVAHWIFGVDTALNKKLFGTCSTKGEHTK